MTRRRAVEERRMAPFLGPINRVDDPVSGGRNDEGAEGGEERGNCRRYALGEINAKRDRRRHGELREDHNFGVRPSVSLLAALCISLSHPLYLFLP